MFTDFCTGKQSQTIEGELQPMKDNHPIVKQLKEDVHPKEIQLPEDAQPEVKQPEEDGQEQPEDIKTKSVRSNKKPLKGTYAHVVKEATVLSLIEGPCGKGTCAI